MRRASIYLLSIAVAGVDALCATDTACRLLTLGMVTMIAVPACGIVTTLSIFCCASLRRLSFALGLLFGALAGWSLYAIAAAGRWDLIPIVLIHTMMAAVQFWQWTLRHKPAVCSARETPTVR